MLKFSPDVESNSQSEDRKKITSESLPSLSKSFHCQVSSKMAAPECVKAKDIFKKICLHLEFYPAIWDSTDSNFHKHEVKDREMTELAQECGISVAELTKKYRTLRTRFRKVSSVLLFLLLINNSTVIAGIYNISHNIG